MPEGNVAFVTPGMTDIGLSLTSREVSVQDRLKAMDYKITYVPLSRLKVSDLSKAKFIIGVEYPSLDAETIKKGITSGGTLATVVFEVKDVSTSEITRLSLSNIKLVDADTHRIGALTRNALLDWEELLIPERFILLQNYPNPFNPETWIPFKLASAANVEIRIYNLSGQLVREMDLGNRSAGIYLSKDRATYWDGRNDYGEKVSSGTYFYTLEAGDYNATKRMLILK